MRGFIAIVFLFLPLTSQAQEKDIIDSQVAPVTVNAAQVIQSHMLRHVDLDNHGLRYRIKIPSNRRGEPALKVEVEGPVVHNMTQPGLVITIRY